MKGKTRDPLPGSFEQGFLGGAEALVADAAAELSGVEPQRAAHKARRGLKRLRSHLRMYRDGMPRDTWKALDRATRDVGRTLAERRNADALVEAAEAVAAEAPRELEEALASVVEGVRAGLARASASTRTAATSAAPVRGLTRSRGFDGTRQLALRALGGLSRRLEQVALDGVAAELAASGVRRTLKRGRKALAAALRDPSPAVFHDWRKEVKHLWHMSLFLGDAWSDASPVACKTLDRLGAWLGEAHDLVTLRDFVVAHPDVAGQSSAAVAAHLDDRRTRLELRAVRLGLRLYEGGTKRIEKRLRKALARALSAEGRASPASPRRESPTP